MVAGVVSWGGGGWKALVSLFVVEGQDIKSINKSINKLDETEVLRMELDRIEQSKPTFSINGRGRGELAMYRLENVPHICNTVLEC